MSGHDNVWHAQRLRDLGEMEAVPIGTRIRVQEDGIIYTGVGTIPDEISARIGKKPAPMLADYADLIASSSVYVIGNAPDIWALLVIDLHDDHLFIENVAVHPAHQGIGLGRRMMDFAEEQAKANGLDEIRLYTHEMMTENLTYYAHLGYEEVDRRAEDGYNRVFMRKHLQKT